MFLKSLKGTNNYLWSLRESRWFSVVTTLEHYIETFNSGHVSLVLHYFAKICSVSSWRFITLPQISAPQIKRSENKNNTSKKKVKLYPHLGVTIHLQLSWKLKKEQKSCHPFFSLEVCISTKTMEVNGSWIFNILLFSWVIARIFDNQVIWTRKSGFIRITEVS